MAQGTDRLDQLIDLNLLDALFDEWMHTNFHTISASGDKIVVIDKDGTRTETNDLAAAAKKAKAEWDNTYKVQITTATTNANTATRNANTATSNANTAAQGASNVNAGLVGFTVTITDRNGTSRSVDIGFEIYRTYQSIAAMNADAANVPQGKFVVIATTSATDPDNAKMYCKNSQGSFTFMSDLDQASSAAWADWLNNMKPQIESAISTAGSDHTRAEHDHSTALSDHSTAQSDHSTAQSDHTKAGNDHAQATAQMTLMEAWNTHLPFIGDGTTGDLNYWYSYNPSTGKYVKGPYAKGDDLHWDEMSEAEKDDLAEKVADVIVFATPAECRAIVTNYR